jgi:hypothetical protein
MIASVSLRGIRIKRDQCRRMKPAFIATAEVVEQRPGD